MKTSRTKTEPTVSTITSPSYAPRSIEEIKNTVHAFSINIKKLFTKKSEPQLFTDSMNKKNKNMKRFVPIALLLIIVGGLLVLLGRVVIASSAPNKTDSRTAIQGPISTLTLNKDYSFPILDSKGKEVTQLKYTIQSAEIRNEIIVKGTKATAIAGRTFLILNIKIVNTYEKGIDLNARDYVRLTVNGKNDELLAADIHNDPVNIQPISTKVTRLGFAINDTDKNIILKVGEIKGNKDSLPLNFPKL